MTADELLDMSLAMHDALQPELAKAYLDIARSFDRQQRKKSLDPELVKALAEDIAEELEDYEAVVPSICNRCWMPYYKTDIKVDGAGQVKAYCADCEDWEPMLSFDEQWVAEVQSWLDEEE